MKKMIKISYLALTAAIIMAAISCIRRPLEYFYVPEARVQLKVDWSDFPEHPTGMTVFIFKEGEPMRSITTSEVDETEIGLSAGRYRLYVMNQSISEIGGVIFNNMDSYDDAEAILSKVVSKWYTMLKKMLTKTEYDEDDGEIMGVGIQPDNLGIAIAEDFELTEEEVRAFQYENAKWRTGRGKMDGDGEADENAPYDFEAPAIRTIAVTAHNVVSQLHIIVNIHNIHNLYSVRSCLDDLAESFMLTQGTTSARHTTQIIDGWNLVVTSDDGRDGYVETTVNTFALPDGIISCAGRDPKDNMLTVQCLHADRITYSTSQFEVGDKIAITVNPRYYRLYMEIEVGTIYLPNHDPAGDNGGFISTVDDWDDLIEVGIPI